MDPAVKPFILIPSPSGSSPLRKQRTDDVACGNGRRTTRSLRLAPDVAQVVEANSERSGGLGSSRWWPHGESPDPPPLAA